MTACLQTLVINAAEGARLSDGVSPEVAPWVAAQGGCDINVPIDRHHQADKFPIPGTEATRIDGAISGEQFGWTYGLGTWRDPNVPVVVDANSLPAYDIAINGPDMDAPPPPRQVSPILSPEDSLLATIGIKAFDMIIAGGYFERYDERVADYNAGKYGTGPDAYEKFVQANMVDAMATGFGTVLTGGIGTKVMQLGMGMKAIWSKVATTASGLFAAGSFFETAVQYGLTEVHRITQGASGQADIDWSKVLTTGAVGGVLGGAGTRLAHSELFENGIEIVGNTMSKLGEIISLGASKSKLIAGQIPDAATGSKLKLQPARAGGVAGRVDLLNEGVVELSDNLIISLGRKDLFQVPKALTQDMASAAKWYREEMTRLAQMVDKTAPLQVQLAQAEKLQALLLKAAEHSLADPDLAGAFRDAFVRSGVKGLMLKHGGEGGLSGVTLQEKVLAELTAPVDNKRRWFEPGACFAKGTLVHTKEGLKPIEQIEVGDWVLSKPENGGEQAYKRVVKTFAHPPQRVVQVEYILPGQVLAELDKNNQPVPRAHLTATPGHPFWTKEEGWTAPSHMQHNGIGAFHFQDMGGGDVEFWTIKSIYLSDQPNVGWTTSRHPGGPEDSIGRLWDYAQNSLVDANGRVPDDIRFGERPDPYFKAPVYNLEVEDFHTYYVGEHGIWVHNQNCDGWNLAVRNTIHPVNFINHVPAFTTRTELVNTLATRGVEKGIFLLRAHSNSQLQELVAGDKRIQNWLKHEEAVPGRLVSNNTGERYEYAGVFKDKRGVTQVIGIEGAEQLGQTVNLIDRKLIFVKAGDYPEVMKSLDRAAQLLDQNPGTSLTFEFNPGVIKEELVHLTRAKVMLEDIRAGSTNPNFQIRTATGQIDTAAMTLLRRMLDEGRILARNAAERTPLPQSILDEGPGLSLESLDLAHVYLQLNQARQYWLDHGASAAQLNQATFAIADLPTGWAARTEGRQITLDASGAGSGWFVDTSPDDHSEFVPASADPAEQATLADFHAAPGSQAEGKLDLLTVLIHELGHVLGLPMPQAADGSGTADPAHAMSQYLSPGQRRLPDAVDIAALQALQTGAYVGNSAPIPSATVGVVGTAVTPAPVQQAAWPVNPQFVSIIDLTAWHTAGQVVADAGGLVLRETLAAQTRLAQAFTLSPGGRSLSFTIADRDLRLNARGPSDAFEVALLDANTGLPLLGTAGVTGLDRNDALLNLQTDGTERMALEVRRAVHLDGSASDHVLDADGGHDVWQPATASALAPVWPRC